MKVKTYAAVRALIISILLLSLTNCASKSVSTGTPSTIDRLMQAADQGMARHRQPWQLSIGLDVRFRKTSWKRLNGIGKRPNRAGAMAQFSLGQLYEAGIGIAKNYEEAAYWHRKAADRICQCMSAAVGASRRLYACLGFPFRLSCHPPIMGRHHLLSVPVMAPH